MTQAVLALDVGGTKTAAALVDEDGGCGPVATVPTRGSDGPAAILSGMAAAARLALGTADTLPGGIGVGTAGAVDPATGIIRYATDTLRGWAGTDIPARLRELLPELEPQIPLAVVNDVEAHALGEAWLGAAAGSPNVLVTAVGTGIGAGVVLDGRVLRGAHGMGGQLAHLPVPAAAHLRCPCGRYGHLEALGSGAGLARHYRSLGGALPEGSGGAAVAAAALRGEALAERAVADSAAAVGHGLASAAAILDPERIVLSGSVARPGSPWWTAMEAAFRAERVGAGPGAELCSGTLGPTAPLIGAARAVRQLQENTNPSPGGNECVR